MNSNFSETIPSELTNVLPEAILSGGHDLVFNQIHDPRFWNYFLICKRCDINIYIWKDYDNIFDIRYYKNCYPEYSILSCNDYIIRDII